MVRAMVDLPVPAGPESQKIFSSVASFAYSMTLFRIPTLVPSWHLAFRIVLYISTLVARIFYRWKVGRSLINVTRLGDSAA